MGGSLEHVPVDRKSVLCVEGVRLQVDVQEGGFGVSWVVHDL